MLYRRGGEQRHMHVNKLGVHDAHDTKENSRFSVCCGRGITGSRYSTTLCHGIRVFIGYNSDSDVAFCTSHWEVC